MRNFASLVISLCWITSCGYAQSSAPIVISSGENSVTEPRSDLAPLPPETMGADEITKIVEHIHSLECFDLIEKASGGGMADLAIAKSLARSGYCKSLVDPGFIQRVRDRQIQLNPNWPPKVKHAVKTGTPFIGMPKEHLLAMYGKPRRNLVSVRASGTFEQLVYGSRRTTRMRVFLLNDKVSSFQF